MPDSKKKQSDGIKRRSLKPGLLAYKKQREDDSGRNIAKDDFKETPVPENGGLEEVAPTLPKMDRGSVSGLVSREGSLLEDKVFSWFSKNKGSVPAEEESFGRSIFDGLRVNEHRGKTMILRGIIAGFVLLSVIVILLSTVFARATIFLKPKVESIEVKDVLVTFDTTVSQVVSSQKVIPGAKLEFVKRTSSVFGASGRGFVEQKARGRARIYNNYGSSPQSLVKSTRFLTESGVLYRLPEGVVVPGAELQDGKILARFIETDLVADRTGEESNISGEVRLTIPGFQGGPRFKGFYAIAPDGFKGGKRGEAPVISKEDIKRASEEVTKFVYEELDKESAGKVPPDFKLVDALKRIEITDVNVPVEGLAQDRFEVSVEAVAKAIVFREKDVFSLFEEVARSKDKNQKILVESVTLQYSLRNADFNKGKAAVLVGGSLRTETQISKERIVDSVRDKKEGSLIELLKKEDAISSFRVSFFPPWLSKSPSDTNKIKIVVE